LPEIEGEEARHTVFYEAKGKDVEKYVLRKFKERVKVIEMKIRGEYKLRGIRKNIIRKFELRGEVEGKLFGWS
jgi:hypothetical protein